MKRAVITQLRTHARSHHFINPCARKKPFTLDFKPVFCVRSHTPNLLNFEFLSLLLGTLVRKTVCRLVANVSVVRLDPDNMSFCASHLSFPDAHKNGFDQVSVFYRSASGVFPTFRFPVLEPIGEALHRIVRVCVNSGLAIDRRNIDGACDGGEFGTLVRLLFPWKRSMVISACDLA